MTILTHPRARRSDSPGHNVDGSIFLQVHRSCIAVSVQQVNASPGHEEAPDAGEPCRNTVAPMATTAQGPPIPAPGSAAVLAHARLLLKWRAASHAPRSGERQAALDAIVASIATDAAAALAAGITEVIAEAAVADSAHAESMIRALGAPHWPQVRAALEKRGTPSDTIFAFVAAAMPPEPPVPTYGDLDDAVSTGADSHGRTLGDLARVTLNMVLGSGDVDAQDALTFTGIAANLINQLMDHGDEQSVDHPVHGRPDRARAGSASRPGARYEDMIEACFGAW